MKKNRILAAGMMLFLLSACGENGPEIKDTQNGTESVMEDQGEAEVTPAAEGIEEKDEKKESAGQTISADLTEKKEDGIHVMEKDMDYDDPNELERMDIDITLADGAELMCIVEDEAEAQALAEQYGITLKEYNYKTAIFHSEEDPRKVIQRGIDNGWKELSLNIANDFDDPRAMPPVTDFWKED